MMQIKLCFLLNYFNIFVYVKKKKHIICMNDNNVFKKNFDENFNKSDTDSRNSKYNENNCVYNYLFL